MAWPEWSLDRILTERPRIRINQHGYLPRRPKVATLVDARRDPLSFAVLDASGRTVLTGRSQPWEPHPEPTSGLPVHLLDFGDVSLTGSGFRLVAGDARSHRFTIGDDLYAQLQVDALRFFTLMRSGTPILEETLPGYARPAGHLGQPPNTGDTAVPAWTGPEAETLYPGWRCAGTFDVSGGWYDAGDYGKYVTSGAIALWQLLSTLELLDPASPRRRAALIA
ncbi:MAG: glycoside hydrolase family 9 protein, partial [Propionibacteriaceae bacterium]